MGQSRAGTDSAIECSWKAVIVINVIEGDGARHPFPSSPNRHQRTAVKHCLTKKKACFILPKLSFDIQAQYDLVLQAG